MTDLLTLLELERIEADLYRANTVFTEIANDAGETYALYGGQVAAQALRAAGSTVDADRWPHSLHGYFLRPGDSRIPTLFKVYRDRDGRSYSARRVVAVQHGKVIFNMSASFQVAGDSEADPSLGQVEVMPDAGSPRDLPAYEMLRLFSIESRMPEQPYPQATWPTRFWARSTVAVPDDPLTQACALTYLSDTSSGVLPAADGRRSSSSIDHAVWFHAPVDMNGWVLSDYQPKVTGHGRGWYTGSIFDESGALVASIAQETLFRAPRG